LTLVLSPEQRSVTWGSCWIRFWKDLAIFGRVLTRQELLDSESEGIDKITDPAERDQALSEAAYTIASLNQAEEDGYVYGWCHSTIEAGEPGSTHRANLWPISDALFEHAAQNGWDPDRFRPIFRLEVAQAYEDYRTWSHRVAVAVRDAQRGIREAREDTSEGETP
jgi:hypothetical protein